MYEICKRCVMDSTAAEFKSTDRDTCNFCDAAAYSLHQVNWELNRWLYLGGVAQLRTDKKYDCLIGLSGGVDSSYVLHKAVELGLRPLCFSVDTGYNKPEADENIMKLVEGLKVPFYRYTIDLDNFREMQTAFMRAGVKNIEIPTDHILMAVSLELASKYKINTILSGGNVATESIMPPSWGYSARDLKHIKSIYKGSYHGIPTCGIVKWNWYRWVKRIKTFYLLDYLSYNRAEAEQTLIDTYGFKSTGEKHEENYFTWWFQNWYLFEKWGIDKRKAHYSSMIISGQMTRKDAMEKLEENPVYPRFGIEKLLLKYKMHEHEEYPMDKWYGRIANVVKLCKF